MAESAGETAQDMMREHAPCDLGFVEGAKQNPIPALMIGVGVAWLLVDRTRNQAGRAGTADRVVGRRVAALRRLPCDRCRLLVRRASAPRYSGGGRTRIDHRGTGRVGARCRAKRA